MKRLILNSRNRSKSFVAFILAIGVMAILVHAQIAHAKAAEQKAPVVIDAKVVGITDGDTITALTNQNEQIKVRIYGIDAPEKIQAYGSKSKQFLSSLIFERHVTIHVMGKDQYGRTIGRIFLDGQDIGITSVEYGMAWWYCQYAKKDKGLAEAQRKAKIQGIGLWADPKPTPPWDFRKKVVK